MKYVVFDIETQNIFSDVGANDPTLLSIALLCLYDSETNSYSSYLEKELDSVWPIIEKADALVGYNSDHFDIPLLNKYYHGDLTKIKSIDLMKDIQKGFGKRIGLDAVAKATLGKGKNGSGLEALSWWKAGEIEKVRNYCLKDVEVTRDLYLYMLLNGHVKVDDVFTRETKTIPVDTKHWLTKETSGITHSLPF